ncbi:hypothetical protein SOVF_044200 [Spinacia oleracea]|nr:hypothetical protein SOVF_044200 [Spinacia oleracea]
MDSSASVTKEKHEMAAPSGLSEGSNSKSSMVNNGSATIVFQIYVEAGGHLATGSASSNNLLGSVGEFIQKVGTEVAPAISASQAQKTGNNNVPVSSSSSTKEPQK